MRLRYDWSLRIVTYDKVAILHIIEAICRAYIWSMPKTCMEFSAFRASPITLI